MSDDRSAFEKVHQILRREEISAIDHNKNHHIPTAYELSVQRSLAVLPGDSGDGHIAEGMAAAKLGIPVEWCPYHEEGYPQQNWLKGHQMGRIFREANPPSLPVLERLACMLEARLRKTDRDYEQHLIGMVYRERRHSGELASRLAAAEKRVAQLEGEYGPHLSAPAMQLRLSIQPIPFQGQDSFRAFFHGLRATKSVAPTKEQAALAAMEEACNVLRHIAEKGEEFEFEWCAEPEALDADRA